MTCLPCWIVEGACRADTHEWEPCGWAAGRLCRDEAGPPDLGQRARGRTMRPRNIAARVSALQSAPVGCNHRRRERARSTILADGGDPDLPAGLVDPRGDLALPRHERHGRSGVARMVDSLGRLAVVGVLRRVPRGTTRRVSVSGPRSRSPASPRASAMPSGSSSVAACSASTSDRRSQAGKEGPYGTRTPLQNGRFSCGG